MKTTVAEHDVHLGDNVPVDNVFAPLERSGKRLPSRGGETVRRSSGCVLVGEVAGRRDRDQFLTFPWQIYRGDKNWAPPLLVEDRALLDRRRHPFYLHGDATQFLAYRGGDCVGRVLVSDDPHYNAQHGTNLGCFGMFESIDDQDVANALVDAAAAWLRRRQSLLEGQPSRLLGRAADRRRRMVSRTVERLAGRGGSQGNDGRLSCGSRPGCRAQI